MKSKFILTILIILVLIILAAGVTLIFVSPKSKFPAGTTVIIASASGAAGATNIAVPITVSGLGTNKIYGVDISLTYDQNLITATGVQKGSVTSSWNLESNISTAGQVRIALYSTSVKSSALSGSKSVLTLTKANLNEITANNKISGEFTISQ